MMPPDVQELLSSLRDACRQETNLIQRVESLGIGAISFYNSPRDSRYAN